MQISAAYGHRNCHRVVLPRFTQPHTKDVCVYIYIQIYIIKHDIKLLEPGSIIYIHLFPKICGQVVCHYVQ